MSAEHRVLLVGGTGRTGSRVLEQLLSRGVHVQAIVRSSEKVPASIAANPRLTLIEADLLSLSDQDMQRYLCSCGAVISCLGHTISIKGIFGAPRDLVTRATTRLCRGIETLQPAQPVKFILMSSVSVNCLEGLDGLRGMAERAYLWVLRGLIPPARDNQRAADFLGGEIGAVNPYVEWVAVRPDTLLEGDISDYTLHESIVSSLFKPDSTNMANVAHFMCELATGARGWDDWKGKLPVIVNAATDPTAR